MDKRTEYRIQDQELIKKVKLESCSSSLLELDRRHGGLFTSVYKKYEPAMLAIGCEEVTEEDRLYILWRAAETFDENRGNKFSSWLGNYTRYFCLKKITKDSKIPKHDDVDDLPESVFSSYDKDDHFEKYILHILDTLDDKRIKKIFTMKYFSPKSYSFANIAKKMSLGNQRVSELHKIGIKILSAKLKNENSIDLV